MNINKSYVTTTSPPFTGTQVTARVESNFGVPTIRHADCEVLTEKERCQHCVKHRKSLHALLTLSKQDTSTSVSKTDPSSHANYAGLNTPEKVERLHNLHSLYRNTKQKLTRLRARITLATEKSGVEVDEELHGDLKVIMKENATAICHSHSEDSFQRLFWEEQLKAASLRDARSMRWHPLLIKWCLYLRHRSGGAYEMLRSSGCLKLPSQRTLRDYTHYLNTTVGFSAEVDRELEWVSNVTSCTEGEKCVVLLVDEMYIKEGLVYDKHSGALIGFTQLGEITDHLHQVHTVVIKTPAGAHEPLQVYNLPSKA